MIGTAAHEIPTKDQSAIHEVDASTLRAWLESGEAVLVDVREPDENMRERIHGALLVPLSRFDPSALPTRPEQRVVLHCRSGTRSKQAAQAVLASGRPEAFYLRGGLGAWREAGLPVIRTSVPISIIRQVQITVGVMILATVALGAFLSAWWLVATAFMGAGLLFAGVSGTCALAGVLGLMPWNRAFRANQGCNGTSECSSDGTRTSNNS